jgi:hypothetical protein
MLHVTQGSMRCSRVARWAAVSFLAASFAIPAGAAARTDPGTNPPASEPAVAIKWPTAKQIAQHRGNPEPTPATTVISENDGNGGGDTLSIVLASSALLVAIGSAGVAVATRARMRQAPQPSA